MSLLNKLKVAVDRQVGPPRMGRESRPVVSVPAEGPGPAFVPRAGRFSNGLKDFLWHLDGIGKGSLLDLGPVWQTTVSFFVERGFKVYTEDLLLAWTNFLRAEETRLRNLPAGEDGAGMTPEARAERFLQNSLQYAEQSFDAVLAWDLFDYADNPLLTRVVDRLSDMLRHGGVILALFHNRPPEGFHRYRVLDGQNLELIPTPPMAPVQRIYQNREIQNLFSRFHSSKTFVGRDQLREGLFIR